MLGLRAAYRCLTSTPTAARRSREGRRPPYSPDQPSAGLTKSNGQTAAGPSPPEVGAVLPGERKRLGVAVPPLPTLPLSDRRARGPPGGVVPAAARGVAVSARPPRPGPRWAAPPNPERATDSAGRRWRRESAALRGRREEAWAAVLGAGA